MKPQRAGIALGSNTGPRHDHLRAAARFLRQLHEGPSSNFLLSSIYETSPVGCPPGSAPFLNATGEISTSLAPEALLDRLQAHEHAVGRPTRRPKNAPRPIDLDLLYLDDVTWVSSRLLLPHPLVARRGFVLAPLAEIAPDRLLPGQSEPVARLAAECDLAGVVRRNDLVFP